MAAFGTGNAAVQCRNPSRAVDKQYEQEVCAPGKRKKMEVNETGKWDASALKELDDAQVQEKIAYEYRMRDGTMKLLAACTDEAQTYEAAKNLHTINARILALMSLLQQHRAKSVIKRRKNSSTVNSHCVNGIKEENEPCKAKVSLSDIRIPLMWPQEAHHKPKTEQHSYYVFCLLKLDCQVLDTLLVETDESETDITFDDAILFENVSHDFKLEIEIYYTVSSDSPANRQLGLPVKRPVRRSASGQVEGPKYILAGHCQLTVDNIHDTITTHDLKTGAVGASASASIVTSEDDSMELSLWGQICLRLAARPECIEDIRMSGSLDIQRLVFGQSSFSKLWCTLSHSFLKAWESEEDAREQEPVEIIEIKPKMNVKDMSSSTFTDHRIIILTSWSHEKEPVLATNTEEDYIKWKEALAQSIRDVTAWKSACKRAMTIENPSRRKRLLTDHRKLYDTIEVTLSPEETQPDENALENVTRVPLGDLPANSSPSVTCSYDIWQRRDPQNRSFGKGKKKNGLSVNYETTI